MIGMRRAVVVVLDLDANYFVTVCENVLLHFPYSSARLLYFVIEVATPSK